MNRSYSKIRHIQESNILLEQRKMMLMEQDQVSVTATTQPIKIDAWDDYKKHMVKGFVAGTESSFPFFKDEGSYVRWSPNTYFKDRACNYVSFKIDSSGVMSVTPYIGECKDMKNWISSVSNEWKQNVTLEVKDGSYLGVKSDGMTGQVPYQYLQGDVKNISSQDLKSMILKMIRNRMAG